MFKLKTSPWCARRLSSSSSVVSALPTPQIQPALSSLPGSLRLADRHGEPVREQERCAELPGAPQHPPVSSQPDPVRASALLRVPTALWELGLEFSLPSDRPRFFLPSLKIWASAAEYVELAKEQVCYQEHRKRSGW